MNPWDQWQNQQQQQGGGYFQQQGAMAQQANPFAQVAPLNGLMTRVYQWMTLALGVTGAVSMIVSAMWDSLAPLFSLPALIVMALTMIGLSYVMGRFVMRMSGPVAFTLLILYSVLNGIWLAPIFLIYDLGTISAAFFATAGMFGGMTIYGYVTKRDLTGWGSFLFMGLIGLLIATVVNLIFFGGENNFLYWLTTYVGVIVFLGLTAYDTQKIKEAGEAYGNNPPTQLAVQGAFELYLDFINIFIYLLRILNRLRND